MEPKFWQFLCALFLLPNKFGHRIHFEQSILVFTYHCLNCLCPIFLVLPSGTKFCSHKNGSSNILLEDWLIFWQISRAAEFRFQKISLARCCNPGFLMKLSNVEILAKLSIFNECGMVNFWRQTTYLRNFSALCIQKFCFRKKIVICIFSLVKKT